METTGAMAIDGRPGTSGVGAGERAAATRASNSSAIRRMENFVNCGPKVQRSAAYISRRSTSLTRPRTELL